MLHIHDISKQYGSKVLFRDSMAHLGHRSRVALIGPNGAGKSTLIRMILGQEEADTGKITRAQHLAIGHLAQEVPRFAGRTVIEETMRMDGRREELLTARQEIETLLSDSSEGVDNAAVLERYGRLLEELEQLDEHRLEARAKEILSGVGFKVSDFNRRLDEFSGGWLMRVALARILSMEPDLLLLDEPTNHLDLESLLWLEEFLRGFRGAMLLVSHDSAFLNRLVTEVIEIDQRCLTTYRGNLDAYRTQKAERLEILRAQARNQEGKIADLQRFVDRFGAKATKASQAQSRVKQIEKLEAERIELPDEKQRVRFRFPPASHSGRETVTLKDMSVRFGDRTLFDRVNHVIPRGARVAIVGMNGAGKTTLLKLVSGAMDPTSGEARLGHLVKVGYYAQIQAETLDMSLTVLEVLERAAPEMPISQVRAIAGAFLFSGDAVEKRCGVLSGGEKARVALAKLLLSPANLLILDEPTNHLDADSREVLLHALRAFEGTLVLVSHDREFMAPLVNSVIEIEAIEGKPSRFVQLVTGYDDYLERKLREARERTQLSKPSQAPESKVSKSSLSEKGSTEAVQPPRRGNLSNNQRLSSEKERARLESEIAADERAQADLAEKLADPVTYADSKLAMELGLKQAALQKGIEAKLSRWEELCALLD